MCSAGADDAASERNATFANFMSDSEWALCLVITATAELAKSFWVLMASLTVVCVAAASIHCRSATVVALHLYVLKSMLVAEELLADAH